MSCIISLSGEDVNVLSTKDHFSTLCESLHETEDGYFIVDEGNFASILDESIEVAHRYEGMEESLTYKLIQLLDHVDYCLAYGLEPVTIE